MRVWLEDRVSLRVWVCEALDVGDFVCVCELLCVSLGVRVSLAEDETLEVCDTLGEPVWLAVSVTLAD